MTTNTNTSIYNAFSKMWEYVIARTGDILAQAKSYTNEKMEGFSSVAVQIITLGEEET